MSNPLNMLKMLIGKKNPQQIASQLMGKNNNPVFNNLMNMMKNGDNKGIETFARNIFKEQGRNFDKEFQDFMANFK